MRAPLLALLFIALALNSCGDELTVSIPDYDAATVLAGTVKPEQEMLLMIEVVYEVREGRQLLGDQVVVIRSGTVLSVLSGRDAGYCIMESGRIDDALYFAGYWRKQTSVETGTVSFHVAPDEGGKKLVRKQPPDSGEVVIKGEYSFETGTPLRPMILVYDRPLYQGAGPFLIVAHRAGGRNSDQLPASENSAELVRIAERFGANGVEIDVQLSKDGIPVVYHDENMNLRLNQKNGLVGSVSDYTIAQLETFVRLKYGERIPTLKRMLATILRQTTLRFVWLDIKPSVPLGLLIDLQRAYRDSARVMNRDLTIVIGLPDEDKAQELLRIPEFQDAMILCELHPETTRDTGAEIWAPRWTLGTQNEQVAAMHAEGRQVISWTLDHVGFIQDFIRNGHFDGILSNYPSLVAFHYYTQ